MTEIKQNGIVISERDIGENDKLLVVLTERYGKLPVIVKGGKSMRNRHIPSTQLFAYSVLGLRKKGNYYYITDSDLIENYYEIRNDIVKLSLATYLCDVVNDVTQEGNNDDEILRLILNMLYAISKDLKPLEMIRATFQIRLAAELGFTPNASECHICHDDIAEIYYFDLIDGVLTCDKCRGRTSFTVEDSPFLEKGLNKPIVIISSSVAKAFEYITSTSQGKILSFTIDDREWSSFFEASEKFLLNHLERSFYSLDFYKTMLI